MDILGIGFSELIFILVIALMVFGPRRLPEMAAKAGKLVADLRNMSQGLMLEWQREITASAQLEELEKTRQELMQTRDELKQAGKAVNAQTTEVAKSLRPPTNSVLRPIVQMPPEPEKTSEPAQMDNQPDETAETTDPTPAQPDGSRPAAASTTSQSQPEEDSGQSTVQPHTNGNDIRISNRPSLSSPKDAEKSVNE